MFTPTPLIALARPSLSQLLLPLCRLHGGPPARAFSDRLICPRPQPHQYNHARARTRASIPPPQLLRGAGCTVNDLWDRDIDRQVARTRGRPIASGAVSVPQGVAFLGAQLALGLGVLLQLNPYTQVLGASSLLLVGTYPLVRPATMAALGLREGLRSPAVQPFRGAHRVVRQYGSPSNENALRATDADRPQMKRVTGWPQAFLGLTINWGALMGWAAARGACDWGVVLPLYAAGVNWSLVYDTIYAHQDKKDDVKVGIGSTALTLGPRTRPALSAFAALQAACLLAAGGAAGAGAAFQAAVVAGAAHQAWQIWSVDLDNGRDCMAKFVSNKWYGGLLYAGIVADRLLL
jgi:4-hydroxybenzoate polyprenyltransferase